MQQVLCTNKATYQYPGYMQLARIYWVVFKIFKIYEVINETNIKKNHNCLIDYTCSKTSDIYYYLELPNHDGKPVSPKRVHAKYHR